MTSFLKVLFQGKIRNMSLLNGSFAAVLDVGIGKSSFRFSLMKWEVSGRSWEKIVEILLCSQIMHSFGVKNTWNPGLK